MATAPRINHAPDWRTQLGARLIQPDEAVSHVKSGDRVCLSIAQATPLLMCTALAGRLMETENVLIYHSAAAFDGEFQRLHHGGVAA